MDPRERDKLYDWLENGRVDVWLRRIAKERLAELESGLRTALEHDELSPVPMPEEVRGPLDALLSYTKPEPQEGRAEEALDLLREKAPEQTAVEVEPIASESYNGRQWGYVITREGRPILHATTGGTGPCWNVERADDRDEPDADELHICDLDEVIAALAALRSSDAHAQNVARWK